MIDTIILLTTMRCNYNCRHCLQGAGKDPVDFPLDLFPHLLTEARQFGAKHVGFTGGEARLHPGFEQMVETVLQHGYTWSLNSNGSQTEPYLELMKRSDGAFKSVSLSLDGADAETHDRLRQREGAFEAVIQSAQTYIEHGFDVKLTTCLHTENKHQTAEIVALGEKLGVKSIKCAGLIPAEGIELQPLSNQESYDLYQQIQDLNANSDVLVQAASALYTRGGINFCSTLNLRSLTFSPQAELLFCCDAQGGNPVIGSLYKQGLPELIEGWITTVENLKKVRTRRIAHGQMGEGFDTCQFCNLNFQRKQ